MEEAQVAGESPDRSKQRESSAGVTPGTGEPVAETAAASAAADPRAAFARTAVADPPSGSDADEAGEPDEASDAAGAGGLSGGSVEGDGSSTAVDGPEGAQEALERPEGPGAAGTSSEGLTEPSDADASSLGAGGESADGVAATGDADGSSAAGEPADDPTGDHPTGDQAVPASGVAAGAGEGAPVGDREDEEPSDAVPAGVAEAGDEPAVETDGAEDSAVRNVPAYGAAAGVSEDAPAAGPGGEPSDGISDAVPSGARDPEDEPAVDADGPADENRDGYESGTAAAGVDEERDGDEAVADADEDVRAADPDVRTAGAAGDPETDEDAPADAPKPAVDAPGAVEGTHADADDDTDAADDTDIADDTDGTSGTAAEERSGTAAAADDAAGGSGTADAGAPSDDREAAVDASDAGDERSGSADADADADADAPSDADREVEADHAAERSGTADADAPSDTDREAEASDADREVEAADADREVEPEDADASDADASDADAPDADAPSGPRRPGWAAGPLPAEEKGDATRTLGKVAPPAAGPDAKGKGPGKPVDQPTTAIRLGGRPAARPPVDQPTTQLKVGDRSQAPTRKPPAAPARPGSPAGPAAPAAASTETTAIPHIGPERTTQQPLPPKPPLDLLAELTNTPPPPDTLPRRMVRRVKIWTPLLVLLAIVLAVVQMVRPLPEPSLVLTAEESFRFDGDPVALPWPDEGQGWMDVTGIGTVDKFGDQKPVPIASVTKSMTAYVIMKEHPLKKGEDGPSVPVDALAEKEGGYDKTGDESTLNTVKEGQKLSLRDALSAVMLPSANNIARLLARWDSGSEAAFVDKMNKTAAELGMRNTTYTDPSGLKETTVSTAEDQVKLGVEMMKMPAMVDITNKGSWKDPSGRIHYNYNTLVPYNGAIGIKTGSTTKAGGNLLFAATKDVDGETVTLVGAVLGQHKPFILDTVNAVSKTAMLATQDALEAETILKKGDVVGYVDDRLGGRTPVVVSEDVKAVGWAGHEVRLTFAPDPTMPHAAPEGTKVGSLTVGDAEGGAVKVPVQLGSDLQEPSTGARLTRVS
ncbi:D-alanyl-D-alanine carboxypeptidase [Streptomyces fragilis]|uniref:D-alanyl-D-alanine carboxypeptidase n=1 Tax=Streptomyces fragilis TaxID=67301 RepID=A0ABV2YD58_9ACTN|nr:D-alanyl-D-alanine carboxypeptidase [Streptomyces fragilis]